MTAAALARALSRWLDDRSTVRRLEARGDQVYVETDRDGLLRWDGVRLVPTIPDDDLALPLARVLPLWRARGPVEVLAYRPGRRLTLRVGAGAQVRVVKGYRPGRLHQAAARHLFAAEALSSSAMGVPDLLEVDEDRGCLVFALADGRPVTIATRTRELFFAVGSGLRSLQHAEGESLSHHDTAAELDVLASLQRRLPACGVAVPEGWSRLADAARAVASVVGPERVPCHRDLHDGQLLDGFERPVLLDLDLLCSGHPAVDVANLTAHLTLRMLQRPLEISETDANACAESLLDGLDAPAGAGFDGAFRFFQATTFLRLVLVYSLRPAWASVCGPLQRYAERCLHDLGA